jgi:hypothetical protein
MPKEKGAALSEALLMQAEIYRRMSGENKLRISLELYELARAIVRASIMESHPGISESALEAETIKRFSR